ncbi:transporter [Klebsiella pneumoniae subsp. rhinoscleromatis]|nr:transporter [Klebsiella pneumoniae subsp. rhinoscleromatis]
MVSLGIVCCLLSGAFTLLAVVLQATPMLAIAALLAGRVFLGVGESFTATGATLWGIKTVGAIHTSRVISWNGVATYVAMAVGAPLGVTLNHYFGNQRLCYGGSAGPRPSVCCSLVPARTSR